MKNDLKNLPVSLIYVDNFPNYLKFEGNELFNVYNVKNDNSALDTLYSNIYTKKCLYNVILSGPIPNPQSPIPNPQSPIPNFSNFFKSFSYFNYLLN